MSANCFITYLPPAGKFHTDAYVENLRRNPTKCETITFSEVEEFNPRLKLKCSVELPELADVKHQNGINFGYNNLCFFLAWAFAWKMNFDHFIYGECDIRVKNPPDGHWDEVIFKQFFDDPRHLIVGGHMMLYNVFNSDQETARRATDLMTKWNPNMQGTQVERNKFIPCYGNKSQADGSGSCVCVNGAGAVYSVAGLRMLFPELQSPDDNMTKVSLAKKSQPFDFEIGKRIWEKFKADAFDVVGHLPCIFSSYGSVLSSEDERLEMLRSGRVVLTHQVKGNVIE